jgi:DNA-binding transcriptional ArsR family regulator
MLPDDLDAVFAALAHRDRRRILDLVQNNPGCRVDDLCRHFTTSRIAILKHLKVLERAELILSRKVGRERRLDFNVMPIQIIYDRWATEFSALWAGPIAELKYRVETQDKSAAVVSRRKRNG